MIIVTATAVIALIVVVVGLASLVPKSKPQSVNELPVAMFTYDANNLTVMFDATASSDPDGSIANYSWTFGDASEGNGKIVTHVYAKDGTFKANLTVTDNGEGKNSSSKDLTVKMTVSPAKKYPVAVIQTEKDGLRVNVSGAKSHADNDATITSHAWTFGDGGSATGVTATHTYAANGTYTVNLTVTDSNGMTNSTTVSVKVASLPTPPPPAKKYPVAVIQTEKDGLRVDVSGAKSHADNDATITSYAWTFGDGGSATGVTATHTYAANGTYTVNLTVTDSNGMTNSTTVSVKVASLPTPPPPAKKYPVAVIQTEKDGLRVDVSGAKSHADNDATITSYAWTFGDGGSATGVTATHTYAANGTYTVNLTVTDSNGMTNSTTVSVKVASPPTPPPPPTQNGPPGLLHAIEIHKEKADRNSGLQNSLDHLQGNLQKWLDSHANAPTI